VACIFTDFIFLTLWCAVSDFYSNIIYLYRYNTFYIHTYIHTNNLYDNQQIPVLYALAEDTICALAANWIECNMQNFKKFNESN
jgi:hypothetical protein